MPGTFCKLYSVQRAQKDEVGCKQSMLFRVLVKVCALYRAISAYLITTFFLITQYTWHTYNIILIGMALSESNDSCMPVIADCWSQFAKAWSVRDLLRNRITIKIWQFSQSRKPILLQENNCLTESDKNVCAILNCIRSREVGLQSQAGQPAVDSSAHYAAGELMETE